MEIRPDQMKAINHLVPKKEQQLFLDQAIEEALKRYSVKTDKTAKKKPFNDVFELFVDGGSRGNPGISGGGFGLFKKGKLVMKGNEFFGIKTNNQAEYLALRTALREIYKTFGEIDLYCFMDSQLAVEQINGRYKVKSDNIKKLYQEVKTIIEQFKDFHISHIAREQNQLADKLANEAMDRGSF